MDTSRRAVESYWRSRMIDSATSDEDKVTPVYKLEEICELLRSSSSGIVKEVSEFLLKRLDHKSPIVKQKALRVIKYSVGKSGPEFRREMQRNSVSVKNLLHYKGQPDPLKGDSLNKAVRETAQDALSAIFSTDDIKPATSDVTHRRMEGFGNTNYIRPQEEKKSFLSEVVDIGSASIKQGLTTLAQAHSQSFKKNDTGTYRGPTLNRSLTNEFDRLDRYDKASYHGGSQGSSSNSRNAKLGNWGQDSRTVSSEITNDIDSGSGYAESKTREERFLETIVTSGGVRLQPTRDALQAFLMEATKMDALALCRALETKLQSPHWQVRVKAVCVLEAILRKRDDEHFAIMASYFMDHIDVVIKCSESPQSSLREKANRVLTLLEGDQTGNTSQKPTKIEKTVVEMPDLIDTGDNDLLAEDPKESQNGQLSATNQSPSSLLIDNLFGGATINDQTKSESKTDDDPFADVSFHTGQDKDQGSDLFAGMTIGENPSNVDIPKSDNLDPFDIFGPTMKSDVNNLMSGLSVNGNGSIPNEKVTSTESQFLGSNPDFGSQGLNETLGGGFDPQKKGSTTTNTSATFPMGSIPYSIPPGMMYNQFYPVGPTNANNPMLPMGMGGLLSQQQLMAAMANIQSLGSLNSHNFGGGNTVGTFGGNVSPIPDIFNAHMPAQTPTVTMSAPKEETKAFDFITDHLTQARDSKRLM